MTRIEKVAVVFGASGGLGEATVVRVAQDYNVVVGYYRGESKAQKLVDGITKAGKVSKSSLESSLGSLPDDSRDLV